MKRRSLIAAGCTAVATTAGCLGSVRDPARLRGAGGGAESPTDERTGTGDVPESRGPVRGESDADPDVREVEADEEVEYLPDDGAVRYVAARRHTNHDAVENGSEPPTREPVYETTPFEDWAETQCVSAAARAAAEHANDELDTEGVNGGITSAIEGQDLVATVTVTSTLDRDGTVVAETDVDFEALVDATPATVFATYVIEDEEFELSVPVFARSEVMHLD